METSVMVHPSSVVDAGARIGAGTKVWHFCHLMPRAVVGEDCNIGQNVFIDNDVIIGKGVKIQNNVSLYKGVIVEDDVFLGPSMVFTNVINPRSFIDRKTEFRHTILRRGSTVGANATIVCGVEIGAYALIGAGAVVIRDVPAHALVVGNPARRIGWVGVSGERLQFNERGEAWSVAESKGYRLEDGAVSTG